MGDDIKGIEMANSYIMPWGKFKNQKMEDIPNSYLSWLARECDNNTISMMADIVVQWREKYGIEK
jgi:uncharacterized protein (DUF3820 family)